MKSVIICEGSTDYVLLQYFMQRVNDWSDYRNPQQMTGFKRVRELKKRRRFFNYRRIRRKQ